MSRGDRSPPGRERTPEERERDRAERVRRRSAEGSHAGPEYPGEPAPAPAPGPSHDPQAERAPEQPRAPETAPATAAPPGLDDEAPNADALAALGNGEVGAEPAPPPRPPLPPAPADHPRAQPAFPPPPPPPHAARPGRGHRSLRGRAGALLALLAVVAAVVLLVRSLSGSGHKQATAPSAVRIVIPEGKTRLQIALIAAHAGLRGSYRKAARRSRLLDPAHYGAPSGTASLEGFLFPATYEEFAHASVRRLVNAQLVAFKEHFSADLFARAGALGVTPYELLTVASMVEREAEIPGDRAKIAAVIYNRLKRGMPLGIDATIYYAVEMKTGIATYTRELDNEQLHIESPYNSRTHVGLPPTPISNPGQASIEAAAHPAQVSYLYYVAGADGCGEQLFSDSQAAFEANAAAYKAAVAKNGGKPPSCKKR